MDRQQVYGAHLDFPGEGRQVKGELELRVCELAATGVGGIWTDYRGCPLKQINTFLQPQHLRRALDTKIKVTALFNKAAGWKKSLEKHRNSAHVSILIIKGMTVLTDQLQASLAGKDDGWSVVLCRISRTLCGAVVSDGHFPCCLIDLRAAGSSPNVLQETERERIKERKWTNIKKRRTEK